MFDTFVAAMKCSNCGVVSPADGSTNAQTHIRDDRYNIAIPVGFELEPDEVADDNLVDSGYLPTGNPSPDGKKRILNFWICPTCHRYNIAEVTFDGTRVAAIEAVPVASSSTARVQFVQRTAQEVIVG